MPTPIVLCPLQIEAKSARRAVGGNAFIVRTGPGPTAIKRAMDALTAGPNSVVVLYGTAGGLGANVIACRASRVVDLQGSAWGVMGGSADANGQTVLGVDAPVFRATEKQDLGARTGAGLVDCESHVFAPVAEDRGWRWGVVRGVTDDERTALPREVPGWAAEDGRTRGVRVIASIIRRPALLREVIMLARRTTRALRAAEVLLRAEIERLSSIEAGP